ncbi:hypothetical protein N7466_001630 [Penicillium verhagenii]|uniref:uncharacterized protein n=1 Tax=Penicillium verhagenii TaxID=1562060 RepID=UPI0025457324|nr:uncharacterized protein N7466_001630 [Penicillium verhagenii]KAJ5938496.1 hypothetical protein N7466_001630 [Penicillium verhagenii]
MESSNDNPNTIVECKCNQRGRTTVFEVAAQGTLDDLHKYLETGWQHFLQQQEHAANELPPCLLDAGHSTYWSKRKDEFCNQTNCVYSPNYATSWHPLPDCYSALIAAIRARSAEKVELLLKLGANPDGYQTSAFETWQALFLRFRAKVDLNNLWDDYQRTEILADIPTQQTVPVTEAEVGSRHLIEFWKGETESSLCDEYPNFGHPLVIAAGSGLITIMEQLLATDVDTSFWTAFPALRNIPEPPTPSSLALSSPIHAAISSATQSIETIQHLIQGGFNPNVLPLGDVCTSITPLMATFLQCEPWNEMAYEVLANDPRIDFIIRTPYLLVNILHVATAYSLQALQRVEQSIPLEAAGATAAGHTLLHIACMSSMIQHHASKTRESIHNLRCKAKGSSSIQQCELEFPAQMEMLGYLLSSGFEPYIGFQDSDLNTPLHYLAGARVINENAITLLRGLSDGERVWREVKNWYGYTAEEIWEQNRRIRTQKDDWYGGTTRKVAKIPPGYEL